MLMEFEKQPIDTHLDDYSPVRSARSGTYERDEWGSRKKRPFGIEPYGLRRKMRKMSHESSDDYKRHDPSNSHARKTRAIQSILRKVDSFHAGNCEELKPENIEKRIPKIIQRCKVRQNLMQLSNDAKVIKNYIQPQFDHYFWRNDLDENYLQDAIKFYES